MNVLDRIDEWRRLDDAASLVERSVEHALDAYCAGEGPAPSPPLVAVSRRLRAEASGSLRSICLDLGLVGRPGQAPPKRPRG